MAEFKTLNVNNGTWDVKDETARNDIDTINDTIDNTITPSLATLNSTKASTTDLTNAIEALDYTDTAVTGQYVSAVSETDGVISVTRDSLPTKLSDFTDDVVAGNYLPLQGGGTVFGGVSVYGTITSANGNSLVSTGEVLVQSDSTYYNSFALEKITHNHYGNTFELDFPAIDNSGYTQAFPAASGTIALTSDITTDIAAAIADLDYSDTAVTGQYVSAVSEIDGVISVTRDSLPTKLSDFTDDVVAGVYQKRILTSNTGTTTYTVPTNTSTNVCTMSIPRGYNIIRVGISVPSDVTATDFMAIFSSTEGSSTPSTGVTEHQYIGNPIGSGRSVIDFEYTGYFASGTTFYCNLLHNNAGSIELYSFARIISIPID